MTIALPPFHTKAAFENSSYGHWVDETLLLANDKPAPRMSQEVHAALRAVLHDPDFPCIGAKSVLNQSSYRFGLYEQLSAPGSTEGLALDLYQFGRDIQRIDGEFHSFIACFLEPKMTNPKTFETLLWQQLAALHALSKPHFDWNAEVSKSPEDPRFSFSFAGSAYFVVGLSPASKRWARRFPWPTLVFNDHFQFERLREAQRFDRIRDLIRERDQALHGNNNPMLEDHGAHSEARQYSGREVGPTWRCPVRFD
jgi:FPC/CPF motif-containing protein YcgG